MGAQIVRCIRRRRRGAGGTVLVDVQSDGKNDTENDDLLATQDAVRDKREIIKKTVQKLEIMKYQNSEVRYLNVSLKDVDIKYYDILNVLTLIGELRKVQSLELDLSENTLGKSEATILGGSLARLEKLHELELNLSQTQLSADGVELAVAPLKNTSSRVEHLKLNLQDNHFGDAHVRALARSVAHLPPMSVLHVSLTDNALRGAQGVSELLRALKGHAQCLWDVKLDLDKCGLTDDDVTAVARDIVHLPRGVTKLSLNFAQNAFGNDGLTALATSLKTHFNMIVSLSLDVSANSAISDEGVHALAGALAHDAFAAKIESLEICIVACGGVTDGAFGSVADQTAKGARAREDNAALSDALRTSAPLAANLKYLVLHLSENKRVQGDFLAPLARALCALKRIETLVLNINEVSVTEKQALDFGRTLFFESSVRSVVLFSKSHLFVQRVGRRFQRLRQHRQVFLARQKILEDLCSANGGLALDVSEFYDKGFLNL